MTWQGGASRPAVDQNTCWHHRFIWRLLLGGAEEKGMNGWREYAADIFTKHGEIAAKMKSAPGPHGFADKVCSGKAVFITMVTPTGVRQDENAFVVQSEITADDLFAD